MNGKLRNMTSLYLKNGDSLLLLYGIAFTEMQEF